MGGLRCAIAVAAAVLCIADGPLGPGPPAIDVENRTRAPPPEALPEALLPKALLPEVLLWKDTTRRKLRLRGAAREVGDVSDALLRVEAVEHRVESDMSSVLAAFANASGPWWTRSSNGVLASRLQDMRNDLAALVTTINATRSELAEARTAVGSSEKALEAARHAERRARVAERLRGGKILIDYETGEVESMHQLLGPAERRRVAKQLGLHNDSQLEDYLIEHEDSLLPELHDPRSRRFAELRSRADPAMLHLDTRFLQDMVVLSLATAVGGLLAALCRAPATLGYMLGGVVVGPSCLDLVRNLEQAETLAQFGSIFLLFSHGLMYSHYYDHRKKRLDRKTRGSPAANKPAPSQLHHRSRPLPSHADGSGHDALEDEAWTESDDDSDDSVNSSDVSGSDQAPRAQRPQFLAARRAFSAGFALVLLLASVFWASVSNVATSNAEAMLVAAAFSLSSSSTVLSTMREANLDDTVFGHTVVELLSVQDLVLAPLLALPTAVQELSLRSATAFDIVLYIFGYAFTLGLGVLAARRLLPRLLDAMFSQGENDDEAPAKHRPASPTKRAPSPTNTATETDAATPESVEAPEAAAKAATPLGARSRRISNDASFGLCVVGYALAMALAADRLKLSHEAGALFAGLVLVGTKHVQRVSHAVAPLASLFGGMYVASLGLVASPQYVRAHAATIGLRVCGVLVVKLGVVALVLYVLGFSRGASLGAGVLFGQVSEVALFVAARAHHLELISRTTYLDVLSSTVVLLAIAPLSVHVMRRIDRKLFLRLDDSEDRAGPWAVVTSALMGIPLSESLTALLISQRKVFFGKRPTSV
ncbi:hypothetical protein M885DRAFT_521829 [Pelagophyceae sp. CCMP2097]|nr:hypothetical protein M885DRAFT_521829 [Pelagophyceae sp. CCMP2097]